ncbi:hypothetical protein C453_03119 [Haloferax elongans ATCC BAA-1513]|uniref:DUF7973 domain-containing protein n=1 Tax=Haloferax elongans ATCC BAA-1513 TaxID=1230453 RepID=M0HU76_HALEO|nr:hypothetical protein [Haloferax elongans]ELZ87308.1 hypothetical protein C453_03119 [Haloferax elongans ATCC BAA-1513]
MAIAELWALEMVLAAFAGGAFGAAIGALPSFTLAGLVVVIGELYGLVRRTTDVGFAAVDLTGAVGLGVVFGPHVAFGGGAAAVAYAAKHEPLDFDSEYHPAKDVTRGLGSAPDVLFVGGVFGIFGYWVATLAGTLGLPTDPVALAVVVSALAHRLVFGYSLIGTVPDRLMDMSPFERGEPRHSAQTDGGHVDSEHTSDTGRFAVEPWLPYQYRWADVVGLGAVVGIFAAYIAYLTGSAFLAFGLSVVALVYINAGTPKIPVTHHMSLPASTAVLAAVGSPLGSLTPTAVANALPLSEALLLGAVFGALGGFFGEVTQRIFYAHADTHLDPPAASIVVTSFVIGVLALVGVFPGSAWVPLP